MSAAGSSQRRVRRVPGAPVVAVRVALAGGARSERIPGSALVAGRGAAEGTRRRSYRELADAAEQKGMTLAGFGGPEAIGVAVDALAADWEQALELAAELLFEPVFPEERIRHLARQAAAELEAEGDQADLLTARAFVDVLYSPHPRGRPLQGDPASLARIDSAVCAELHGRALARGGSVAVAGEIDEDRVAARLEALFGGLAEVAKVEPVPPPPPPSARRREIRTRARDQAHLMVGQLTAARADPDAPALELAAVVLGAGSGLSGRIPHRVRDQEGLGYHASADAISGAGLDAGRLVAYVGTSPATLRRAERAIVDELRRVVEDGVSGAEVEEARAYLLGREPFRRETARQWADLAAYGAIVGLPLEDPDWTLDRLRGPDRDRVEAAIRGRIDPERLAVVVGLPAG